jgi:hypothetical protein
MHTTAALLRPSLLALVTLVASVGCAAEDLEEDGEQVGTVDAMLNTKETKKAIAALGLGKHDCGGQMAKFKPAPDMKSRIVFTGHRPWHKWNACLKDLHEAAKAQGPSAEIYPTLYHQVLYILSESRVKFQLAGGGRRGLSGVMNKKGEFDLGKFNRVVETNDNGLAYSTMDQTDLGGALLSLHKLPGNKAADAKAYKALALASLHVVTDTVDKGGLRSVKTCEKKPALKCSWFHAQTSTDATNTKRGGTLNKHLYGVRDLYQAGNALHGLGDAAGAAHFRGVAMQGMNQMVYSSSASKQGDLPTLADYIPRHQGKPIQNSWLYYGRNIVEGKSYFLDEKDYKNCNYHLLVLRLLDGNLKYMLGEKIDVSGFTEKKDDLGTSILGFILETYEMRLPNDLYKDLPTKPGGNFDACSKKETDEMEEKDLDLIHALLKP